MNMKSFIYFKQTIKTSFIKTTRCLHKALSSCICIKKKRNKKNNTKIQQEINTKNTFKNKVTSKTMNDENAIEINPNECSKLECVETETETETDNDNNNDKDTDIEDVNTEEPILLFQLDDSLCFKNDYDTIRQGYQKYIDFFSPLLQLKEGDKINIYNNTIYVSNNSWFQSMERWYYSQSRQYSLDILEDTFNEYIVLTSSLIQAVDNDHNLESIYKSIFSDITSNNIKLSVSLIELSKTYQQDEICVKRYNEIRSKLLFENTTIINKFY